MFDSIKTPTTQLEFEQSFQTEEACINYLISIRWPDGPRCLVCNGDKFWRYGTILTCSSCRQRIRVLAGTVFQDTHLPLMIWFRVIWLSLFSKQGVSALHLHRLLGVSEKAMWHVLHKLRRAMIRPGRERLAGRVEVDETYIGGLSEGTPGRGAEKKALVVIAVEIKANGRTGRARMKVIGRATAASLIGFVEESVEPASTVITDGWRGYSDNLLTEKGYAHEVGKVKKDQDALPHVHLVISLLKRVLLGTFQGAVSHEHLGYYLDEYTFKFNRRTSKERSKLFVRLLENAVQMPPVIWKDSISKPEKNGENPVGGLEDDPEILAP